MDSLKYRLLKFKPPNDLNYAIGLTWSEGRRIVFLCCLDKKKKRERLRERERRKEGREREKRMTDLLGPRA